MAKNEDLTPLLLLAGAAAAAYILYENGTLQSWFPSLFGATPVPATASAPTTTSAPVSTPSAPAITAPAQITSGGTMIPAPSVPIAPVTPPPTSPAQVLTVADAAQFPFSSAISAAQMNAIDSQLQSELSTGIIPTINGDSVLAYMLGWGAQKVGATETVLGHTYAFDGTNWNLGKTPVAKGVHGATRIPMGMIHSRDYRFRRT